MAESEAGYQQENAPLYSADAEEEVLRGALTADDEMLTLAVAELDPEDFYLGRNRRLFAAIEKAAEDHDRMDPTILTVTAGEEVGEYAKKVRQGAVPDLPTMRNRAQIVKSYSLQRRVIHLSQGLSKGLRGPAWRDAMWAFYDGVVETTAQDIGSEVNTLASYKQEVSQELRTAKENAGVVGLRTGIWPMDMGLGGLQRDRLTIVAGRPGTGKTLLTRQIAANVARQDKRVLICDTEMPGRDTLKRLAFAVAGVPWGNLEKGNLSNADLKALDEAMDELGELPIFIDASGRQTVASIRRQVIRHKPDLLIVDYLQQVTAAANTRDNREREVASIADGINQMKKMNGGIHVLAAAQLSRAVETRNNKRPMLSDLRDSGVIEQDADAAVFLYRAHLYDKQASEEEMEFLCRKNRHGSTWEETMFLRSGAMWVEDDELNQIATGQAAHQTPKREAVENTDDHITDANAGPDQVSSGMVDDFDDFDFDAEMDID